MSEQKGILVQTHKARRVGQSGVTVQLARSWVDDEEVDPGDYIEQRRDGASLILTHVKRTRIKP